MSCGQIALNRAGISYDNYFASEIKRDAIKVTQHNYPNTIQLGDIRNIKAIDLPKIDLLIGGSPCQDFSIANKTRAGLQGAKSSLFYEYIRILNEVKPKYFLLENVSMETADRNIISNLLGINPININSQLVSAQLRERLYWTNIAAENTGFYFYKHCTIEAPKDKGITLQSILENGYTDRIKARSLLESESRPLTNKQKLYRRYKSVGMVNIVFDNPDCLYNGNIRILTQNELERLQTVPSGYTSILSRNKAAGVLGDGWTVDVISHIFSYLNKE